MFRSMLGKVLGGLTNIGPVKNLIKYILDRSLNELLSDQVKLDDFKNGQLLLTNIGLNVEKINRDYLLSSPYILHQGRIRRLRVTLPGWSELSTRSIEVAAEGLQIDLKPNKRFADNFKEAMREQTAEIYQQAEPGELDQSNPLDFFRQLVKQIILNMKITIENSVVRLFINEPTGEPSAKPQYYLMSRIPLLAIGKSEESSLKPQQEETDEIGFDLKLPQLSLHLLKEGADIPEYANEKVDKPDFPFTYPPIWHPSTILLLGQTAGGQCSTRLKITLTTLFKQQKRLLVVQGRVGHLEVTVDPIQLKILTRFMAQLMQFQRILKSVMNELGLGQPSFGLSLSRKDSRGKSGNHDFFSSVMMSISQPSSKPVPSNELNIFNNLMQSPQMQKAASEFNQNAVAQLRSSGSLRQGQGWKNINFKQEVRVVFELEQLQGNFPKYVTAAAYERRWTAEKEGSDRVNESLGCSHFRLSVRGVRYEFNSGSNLHQVRLRIAKLQDARLKNQQSFYHSVSEEFYQLDSSEFYSANIDQDYFTRQPDLVAFRLGRDQHYCLEELFRLSQGRDPQIATPGVKTYAFMPAGAACGEGAGLLVRFNGDNKALRVQIKEVAVMLNFQIWKDVLNIIFPVFLYRKLHERVSLQASKLPNPSENTRPLDLFESQYRFSGQLLEESQERQQRVEVKVRLNLIYCFYRQTAALKPKQNLFEEVERKILDSDNFSKGCFCDLTERGLYAQLRESEWQQIGEQFNLSVGEVKAGLLNVTASKIEEDVKPILIVEQIRVQESKVEVGCKGAQMLRSRIFVPKANLCVQLAALISFVDMAKKMVGVVDSLLAFKRSLSAKLLIIEQELTNKPRSHKQKMEKERVLEVFVGEVELKMLLISTYLRGFFFRKRSGQQEVKLDALAVGLSRKLDIRLGQFKNQMLTQQYPLTEKYPSIRDTNLILEIGREAKPKTWKIGELDPKYKKKIERRLDFFSEVQKETASLWVIVKEKIDSGEKKSSKDFRFEKARKNSVIEQQKRIKEISVLPLSVDLHAGNMAFLMRHQQQIQNIFKQVGQVMNEIKEQSRDIMDRKDQIESESETTTEILLSLKDIQLNIDIRPDFYYEEETGIRVLSNTRMMVAARLQKLSMIANPDSQQANIDFTLTITAHFLHHSDKDVQPNPLLLSPRDLDDLGFRRILDLTEMIGKIEMRGKGRAPIVECGIDNVKVQLCLTSLPLLQLFLDHFLRHSLAGDEGSIEDQRFIVLDHAEEEEEPEDLTQKLEQYEKMLEDKRKIFQEFSMRQFAVRDGEHPKLVLRLFKVNSLKVKLFGGNEFRFMEVNSLYESKANKRSRIETAELLNYFSFSLDNFKLKGEQGDRTHALTEIERLQLQLSYKRRENLLWGAEKDYSVYLLKINTPIKILLEMSAEYLKVKLSSLEVTASLTDQIFSLAEQFSAASKAAELSPWKRQYAGGEAVVGRRMLLLILPEGRITSSAEFKRTKLLNERVLRLQELIVHEEQSNNQRIGQIFHDWAMRIFTSNLGTLVSGALFEVLSACIGLLFGGIRQLLALFFPRLRD